MYQIAIIPSGIDTGRQRNYPIRCRQLGAGIIIPIRRHRIQKRLKIFRFREMIPISLTSGSSRIAGKDTILENLSRQLNIKLRMLFK